MFRSPLLQAQYRKHVGHYKTDFQLFLERNISKTLCPVDSDDAIVVFTDSADREISELSLVLAARGLRLIRVNCDDDQPSIIRGIDTSGRIVVRSGKVSPKVVWTRRFWRYIGKSVTDPESVFVYDQMNSLRNLLEECCEHLINGRMTIRSKLGQLKVAQSCGLNVPATVLSADISDVQYQLGTNKVVIKSLDDHWVRPGGETVYGAFPAVRDVEHLARHQMEYEYLPPLIVQEHLEIDSEVRVFVVGKLLVAYRTESRSTPGAIWLEDTPLDVVPYDLDKEYCDKILDFVNRICLEYGAIDLAHCREGGIYFLECNDSRADWRYYEQRARDLRVRQALVEYLGRLMHV